MNYTVLLLILIWIESKRLNLPWKSLLLLFCLLLLVFTIIIVI